MWVKGTIKTSAGDVSTIKTDISSKEKWEHAKCRMSGFRNAYAVEPGLYAAGMPDEESEVFVSANYKLSFDHLRASLKGINAWVLVLDTKGINVWCAAGKKTFGTSEVINRVVTSKVDTIVKHRRLILPQLGAVGVSAHGVKQATGFRVSYGPVLASDIPAYLKDGRKASDEMRRVKFPILDRVILTPMEMIPAMVHFKTYALAMLVVFGLTAEGIMFGQAWQGAMPMLIMWLAAVFAGAFLTPALLPFVPFRSFGLKGLLMGLIVTAALMFSTSLFDGTHMLLRLAAWLWFPLASSYLALQFTGSTTFTGMSGVNRELRKGLPIYIMVSIVSVILIIVERVIYWRAI